MRPLIVVAAVLLAQISVAFGKHPPYIDLTTDFARFVDETAKLDEPARVALFRQRFDSLPPGFYGPRTGDDPKRYEARVARELEAFSALRPAYERVQREFPAAYAAGIEHFRKVFPGFMPQVPVYLLHSLGEMDGGVREFGGKVFLIFGADVIGQIHEQREITPFLDHELFHVENNKYFTECAAAWCSMWAEGLATYAAATMNPGADDKQLLLTYPQPIRPAVDATWPAAACFAREKLFSTAEADINALFVGNSDQKSGFPDRFGYYVALRAVESLGANHSLPDLAHMRPEPAKAALTSALDSLIAKAGGCK